VVINPKIFEKIDKFDAPNDIKKITRYLLQIQDNAELENTSSKAVSQTYEKVLTQYASNQDIVNYCNKYQT
jgi:hypothetical protein